MPSLYCAVKPPTEYYRALRLPAFAAEAGLGASYKKRNMEAFPLKKSAQVSQNLLPRGVYKNYCDELLSRITADQQALSASAGHLKHLLEASQGFPLLPAWLQRLFGGSPVPDNDDDDDGDETYRLRLGALADLYRLTGDQLARLAGDMGALRAAPGTHAAASAFRQHACAARRLGRTVAGLVWHLETAARMLARGGARAVVRRDLVALVAGHEYKICWHFECV